MTSKTESAEVVTFAVKEVSRIVSTMAGIQLGDKQVPMVENRLRTRMSKLGIATFSNYLDHLKTNQETESQALLSLMTTHHTYFFREFGHFEFLINKGLNGLVEKARARGDKKIRVWSAASSRGQEVYSLAMFFQYHLSVMAPDVTFEIIGTDIDPESVKFAQNGVYKADELKQSPAMYINGNWVRGQGNVKDFMKAKDTIRNKCSFDTLNLLKPEAFLANKIFDVIFCRNVFIYFNADQVKFCTERMMKSLDSDGFLFLGVSESINGLNVKAESCGPSIYHHPKAKPSYSQTPKPKVAVVEPPPVYNILCVDDSKAIHALLSRILVKESGFVIKDIAYNGKEALEKIKSNKYDAITLDMHMPELDGVGFLQATQGSSRPPVVVLSSVNRDDVAIAQNALRLGASDYIEKPSLENISQAGNEIRSKLKMAIGTANVTVNTAKSSIASSSQVAPSLLKKKKVLIVDDSKTIRTLLSKIISGDPQLEVVAEAEKPSQVDELIQKHKPDVITLDINMPEMDGVTLLKQIFPKYHIPTVMISSISREEGSQVLNALEAGAIDYIQKPEMSDLAEATQLIRDRIRTASTVKIASKRNRTARKVRVPEAIDKNCLVVIGSSTGGTEALKEIFTAMPDQIPSVLIVQHIPPVFSAAFAQRLNDLCPFTVKEAKHGDEVLPNQVLIAPGGKQMGVKALKDKLIVTVTDDAPVNRHKPSVDYLFNTVADIGLRNVVGVILTGMGADGAKMLKRLKDQGAKTIAQDKETSVVFGMPGEAVKLGAAHHILPLDQIAQKIVDCCFELIRSSTKKVS